MADEIASLESRVSDAIFEALRSQLHSEAPAESNELERRLTRVRRSLQKAEMLLRVDS